MGLLDFLTTTDTLVIIQCGVCHIKHAIPREMNEKNLKDGSFWYCPNGHHIHYMETENQRLKKQVEQQKQDNEWYSNRNKKLHDQLTQKNHVIRAEKAAKTKLKKRIANGVCPCCTRSFTNLQRHMETQHPDFKKQTV